MTDQIDLFGPIVPVDFSSTMSHSERFEAFHAANPHVFEGLKELALKAAGKGYRKLGIRMIWEVLRWNRMMQTRDPNGDFKLNDHYHSRYARLLMEREPLLDGLFHLRELKTQ